jgi:hypothetical protein
MKKKNSLKDMLKAKRPLIGYKVVVPEGRSTIIKKSLKEYETGSSAKENHAYGKFM